MHDDLLISFLFRADPSGKSARRYHFAVYNLEWKHGEWTWGWTAYDPRPVFGIERRGVAWTNKMFDAVLPTKDVTAGVGTDRRVRDNSFGGYCVRLLSQFLRREAD
jgi:hypothetical protein